VYFHLWCDRLACREHADAPHDCGRFKGKDSIEEESASVEVAPSVPLLDGLGYDPGTTTTYGDGSGGVHEVPVGEAPPLAGWSLADMEAASAAVRARRDAPGDQHRCDNCMGISPQTCMFNSGAPADAALEPDPPRWPRDANGRLIMQPRPVGRDTVDLAEAMNALDNAGSAASDGPRPRESALPAASPWWRRMLGGTR
jgi:hypothetical protein